MCNDKIPVDIIEKYFFIFAGYAKKKSNGILNGGCPVCREDNGKYWTKRARLYYIPENNFIFCHNCNKSWTPIKWIQEVSGMSYHEILEEAKNSDFIFFKQDDTEETTPKFVPTLPHDSINLFDDAQKKFYGSNSIVKLALETIRQRRLDTAANKVPLFISLKDYVHKNRICIPFYDEKNKITFYQSRALLAKDSKMAKYLSKANADKTIFGLNKIDTSIDYLFITEGPIDSMFISKNGISMAGLHSTALQDQSLSKYIGCRKIWILDNQLNNQEVYQKYLDLFKRGESVFLWPKEYKNYKDINEVCIKFNIDSIDYNFFVKHSYQNQDGIVNMNLRRPFSQS